jgi:hypothetical protein
MNKIKLFLLAALLVCTGCLGPRFTADWNGFQNQGYLQPGSQDGSLTPSDDAQDARMAMRRAPAGKMVDINKIDNDRSYNPHANDHGSPYWGYGYGWWGYGYPGGYYGYDHGYSHW